MGMLLSDQSEYIRGYAKASYSTWKWIVNQLRKALDLMITFFPISCVLFFLILTVLANFIWGSH